MEFPGDTFAFLFLGGDELSGEVFLKGVFSPHAAKAELDEEQCQGGDENEDGDLDALCVPTNRDER